MSKRKSEKIKLILFHTVYLLITVYAFQSNGFMFDQRNYIIIGITGIASILMFMELLDQNNNLFNKYVRAILMGIDVIFILTLIYTYLNPIVRNCILIHN